MEVNAGRASVCGIKLDGVNVTSNIQEIGLIDAVALKSSLNIKTNTHRKYRAT